MRYGMKCLAVAAALVLHNCSNSSVTGNGGSSETVNAKVAIVDTAVKAITASSVEGGLSLQIFSVNYHPFEKNGFRDSMVETASDTLHWNAPASGTYNLLLRSAAKGVACFLPGVSLNEGAADTIDCTLGPPVTLAGCLAAYDSSGIDEPYVLSIFGSPFYSLADSLGRFAIASVPSGRYNISVRSAARRLFISTSNYTVATESFDPSTSLRIVIR